MEKPDHVVFVSRQRLIGRTNGSSAYLLDLAAAVDRAGLASILIQPSPSLFGRMPVLRLRPEMDIFSLHHVRGSAKIGPYLIALKPSIWISAVHGVCAKLAGRAGFDISWLRDRKAPYSIAMPWTQADENYTAEHTPDGSIIIADYIFQNKAFDRLGSNARATATIMHDLFHHRAETVAAAGVTDSVISVEKDDEIRMLGQADLVIAIQQAEADFVLKHVPRPRVITVPISFSAVEKPQPGRSEEIFFVGSNTEPNIAGLRWFLQNCWQKIIDSVPGATMSIVGSVAIGMASYPTFKSVTYLGIVDDLGPLYSRSGIVVSPLTFGSGLKIKLVEAMSLGKAIVATSVTLQGIDDICNNAVCRADDADKFAAAVISLSKDRALRAKMGNAAIAVAREHFSASAAQDSFIEWLKRHSGAAASAQDSRELEIGLRSSCSAEAPASGSVNHHASVAGTDCNGLHDPLVGEEISRQIMPGVRVPKQNAQEKDAPIDQIAFAS